MFDAVFSIHGSLVHLFITSFLPSEVQVSMKNFSLSKSKFLGGIFPNGDRGPEFTMQRPCVPYCIMEAMNEPLNNIITKSELFHIFMECNNFYETNSYQAMVLCVASPFFLGKVFGLIAISFTTALTVPFLK